MTQKLLKFLNKYLLNFLLIIALFSSISPLKVSAQTTTTTPTNTSGVVTPTRQAICGGSCPLLDSGFTFTKENVATFIISFARFLTYIGVALSVLMIVFAGVQFIVGRREQGRKNLVSTLIGLVVIIIAYTIIAFIVSFLQGNALSTVISPTSTNY